MLAGGRKYFQDLRIISRISGSSPEVQWHLQEFRSIYSREISSSSGPFHWRILSSSNISKASQRVQKHMDMKSRCTSWYCILGSLFYYWDLLNDSCMCGWLSSKTRIALICASKLVCVLVCAPKFVCALVTVISLAPICSSASLAETTFRWTYSWAQVSPALPRNSTTFSVYVAEVSSVTGVLSQYIMDLLKLYTAL